MINSFFLLKFRLSWLNKNFIPDQDFKTYIANTKITRKDLETVFATSLIDSLKEIFNRQFGLENCPYKAFEKKVNMIYVFDESNAWKVLSLSDFAPFINMISQGLISEFQSWQDENYERIFSESFSEVYLTNIKKVNKTNLNTSRSLNMLYKMLYNHLKVPLNIVEYEIK